jgi:glycosyltransferase involved in cell wall biosynthesis
VVRHGETGLLAACDDVPSLARAVASILDDRELAARLSSAGRKHAKAAFSVTRLVEDHDELYRRLLVHQRSPLA